VNGGVLVFSIPVSAKGVAGIRKHYRTTACRSPHPPLALTAQPELQSYAPPVSAKGATGGTGAKED